MGYEDRIRDLSDRAAAEREAFEPPAEPGERATRYLREGVGPAVSVYCESHTGGDPAVTGESLTLLQETMNDWLELYARCYGVDLDADFSVRTAAELLVDTHSIRDTAEMLTHVPDT
jgi:hypothetical protein